MNKPKQTYMKPYTQYETQYITRFYGFKPPEEIARHLQRSTKGIEAKWRELFASKHRPASSVSERTAITSGSWLHLHSEHSQGTRQDQPPIVLINPKSDLFEISSRTIVSRYLFTFMGRNEFNILVCYSGVTKCEDMYPLYRDETLTNEERIDYALAPISEGEFISLHQDLHIIQVEPCKGWNPLLWGMLNVLIKKNCL